MSTENNLSIGTREKKANKRVKIMFFVAIWMSFEQSGFDITNLTHIQKHIFIAFKNNMSLPN